MEELCDGCPPEFRDYMEYARRLKFEEMPDYQQCIDLFDRCLKANGINPSTRAYSWKKRNQPKGNQYIGTEQERSVRKPTTKMYPNMPTAGYSDWSPKEIKQQQLLSPEAPPSPKTGHKAVKATDYTGMGSGLLGSRAFARGVLKTASKSKGRVTAE